MLKYILAFVMLLATPAMAEESAPAAITANGGYAYAPIGMSTMGVGYLSLINATATADAVVSAQSDAFKTVELHDHIHEDGVMKMRQVQSIALPAGATVEMKSGGLHLMLIEPTAEMVEGAMLPLTLTLQSGAEMKTQLVVKSRKAAAAPAHHGHH